MISAEHCSVLGIIAERVARRHASIIEGRVPAHMSNDNLNLKRRNIMKKYARVMVAVTFLFGLSVAANAEIRSEVVVTLPFGFVAGGKILPAGKYTVSRLSQAPFDVLQLTSDVNGTSVFVRHAEMEEATTYKPSLSFHKVGDQNFLSAIETADYVYNFSVSRSVVLEAAAKQRDTVAVSGSAGSK
jgi:hypothetical protein